MAENTKGEFFSRSAFSFVVGGAVGRFPSFVAFRVCFVVQVLKIGVTSLDGSGM